jgi:hypothetical protein
LSAIDVTVLAAVAALLGFVAIVAALAPATLLAPFSDALLLALPWNGSEALRDYLLTGCSHNGARDVHPFPAASSRANV